MKIVNNITMRRLLCLVLFLPGCFFSQENSVNQENAKKIKVVFIAGKDSHALGCHEHTLGCQLLAKKIKEGLPQIEPVVVLGGWPKDESVFEGAKSVVIYCDGGKRHVMNSHLETMEKLIKNKVGIVCLHYGVEVIKGSESSKTMLKATGGYFETDWSVNPHWEADFKSLSKHPITNGVNSFKILDEWYFNMRFVEEMKGISPILSAVPPASTVERRDGAHSGNKHVREMVARGDKQHVGWAYTRSDGGRGFGFTGGHFHKNWENDDFRKVVLNAIAWSANVDIPEKGVVTSAFEVDLSASPKKKKK